MAVSRKREFLADATGGAVHPQPAGAGVGAGEDRGRAGATRSITRGAAHLCIVDPSPGLLSAREGFLADVLASHPPIRQRIIRLQAWATSRPNARRRRDRSCATRRAPHRRSYAVWCTASGRSAGRARSGPGRLSTRDARRPARADLQPRRRVREPRQRRGRAAATRSWSVPTRRALEIRPTGAVDLVGVRFRPGGAAGLASGGGWRAARTGLPLAERLRAAWRDTARAAGGGPPRDPDRRALGALPASGRAAGPVRTGGSVRR